LHVYNFLVPFVQASSLLDHSGLAGVADSSDRDIRRFRTEETGRH